MSIDIDNLQTALAGYISTALSVDVLAGGIPSGTRDGYGFKVDTPLQVEFLEPPAYQCSFLVKAKSQTDCATMCDRMRAHLPKFGVTAGAFALFYLDALGDAVVEQGSDMGAVCWLGTLQVKAVVKAQLTESAQS